MRVSSVLVANELSLHNHGDTAMFQTTVTRLRALWPHAQIRAITQVPERLAILCPGVVPVPNSGCLAWFEANLLPKALYRILPRVCAERLRAIELALRQRFPSPMWHLLRRKMYIQRRHDLVSAVDSFLEAMRTSDMVVVSGGGAITDAFKGHAITKLKIFRMAVRLGKPTAMFGQGIGPLQDSELTQLAARVLPLVDLLALREGRAGPRLLDKLGVSRNRIVITGDDAIEPALGARGHDRGSGIGVNLRIAAYAEVEDREVESIRRVIQLYVHHRQATIVPVPVYHPLPRYEDDSNSDAAAIRRLLKGFDEQSDGGAELDSPEKAIGAISGCRVMVTGSYHAAVFALAQGVPSVCLAGSPYYVDKFQGLADQFGAGCEVVQLYQPEFAAQLHSSLDIAWNASSSVRQQLRHRARQQVDAAWSAYKRFREIVESRYTTDRRASLGNPARHEAATTTDAG